MRICLSVILVFVLGILLCGCGGGSGITLVVGNITGPTTVGENSTADYTVSASGDTGITYLWAVDPPSAGVITGGTTSSITFDPELVTADFDIILQVTVTSDNAGPEVATLTVTVTDIAVAAEGWAVTWGGTSTDWSSDVLISASGEIYTVGRYAGTSDFDPGIGTANLTSNGSNDAYLAKFTEDGEFMWAVSWGGPDFDYAIAVAEDSTGNVYVIGGFRDMVDFDPGAGVASVFGEMHSDVFMSMFDSDGNFVWVQTWGGGGIDSANAILIDELDRIWVGGVFSDVVDFDPGAGIENMTSNGDMDVYISLFDSSGNFNSVITWGGTGFDNCSVLTTDPSGIVYVGGFFCGTVDFDPGSGTELFASAGDSDAFLSVFDSSGGFLWTKTWGGISYDTSNGIVVDGSGNVLVTGYFSDTVDFNPGAGTNQFVSAGLMDAFLTVFNSSGDYLAAYVWGGTGSDMGFSVMIDSAGDIYVLGDFVSNPIDFDPGPGTKTIVPEGLNDFFLSKFDSSFDLLWVQTWGGVGIDYSPAMDIDASDNVYLTGYFYDSVDFDPGIAVDTRITAGLDDAFLLKVLPNGLWE